MAVSPQGTPTRAEAASGTSLTIDKPAGAVVGEHLILGLAVTAVTPVADVAGFTAFAKVNTTSVSPSIGLFRRLIDGTEGANFGLAVPEGRSTAFMIRVSGMDPTVPLDVAASTINANTGTSFVFPSVTTTTANAMALTLMSVNSASRALVPPATDTELVAHTLNIGRSASLAYELLPTPGATGTRTWSATPSVSIQYAGIRLILRANSGGPAPTPTLTYSWIGGPSSSGLTVSAKTANATAVRLKVGTNAGLTTGVVFSSPVVPDSDGWAQLPVTGLSAATPYFYGVEMTDGDGGTTLSAIKGPGKTLPTAGSPASFLLAWGSCLTSGSTATTAFDFLLGHAPDLFFHVGDFHYANSQSTSQAVHRQQLEDQLAVNSGLASVLATIPNVYIKSDHDSGGPNGSLPGAWSASNRAAHLQIVPHLPQVVPEALYHSVVVGRIKFIFTDDRYPRTTTSYLGTTAQKDWFKAELLTDEPVKVWAQSGPWLISDTPTDPAAGGDKWSDYPDEHTEIGDYIATSAVGQVITIHGDAHSLLADDGSNNAWGGFPVLGSAPFNNTTSIKGGPYSQGTWPTAATIGTTEQQFGLLDVVDDGTTITLTYSGRDKTNTQRVTHEVVVSTAPALVVEPQAISSTATVGQPGVAPGPVTLAPQQMASTAVVGQPTTVPGPVTLALQQLGSTAAVGQPTISAGPAPPQLISPQGIGSGAIVGQPTVLNLSQFLAPAQISSTATVGAPVVSTDDSSTGGAFVTLRHDIKVRVGDTWGSPTWAVIMPGGVGVDLTNGWAMQASVRREPRDGSTTVYTYQAPIGITLGTTDVTLANGTTVTTSTVALRHTGVVSQEWPIFVGRWDFEISKGDEDYTIAAGSIRTIKQETS